MSDTKTTETKQQPNPATDDGVFELHKLNTGLIEASSKEHLVTLHYHLSPEIERFFRKLFKKAKKYAKHNKDVCPERFFQAFLQQICDYDDDELKENVGAVTERVDRVVRLRSVLRLIISVKAMILASIRPTNGNDENIEVIVPSPDRFVHTVLCLAARKLFAAPSLMNNDPDNRVSMVVTEAIDNAITELTPHTSIVDTYLKDTVDAPALDGTETSTPTVPTATTTTATDEAKPVVESATDEEKPVVESAEPDPGTDPDQEPGTGSEHESEDGDVETDVESDGSSCNESGIESESDSCSEADSGEDEPLPRKKKSPKVGRRAKRSKTISMDERN